MTPDPEWHRSLTAALEHLAFRHGLTLLLFLSIFAWYVYPLGVVDYFLWKTEVFTLDPPDALLEFAKGMAEDRLGLEEIPKVLVGMVGAAGFGLMLTDRKNAPVSATFSALLLVFVVLAAAFAAVATYHLVITYATHRLEGAWDSEKDVLLVADVLQQIAASRFRELWVLLSALGGFSVVAIRKD